MTRSKTVFSLILVVLFLVAVIAVSAQAQAPETKKEPPYSKPYPMGFVTIKLTSAGLVAGVQWGDGVLTYKGKQYTFKVRGIQLATVGISTASLKGEVYNLAALGDFPGQYAAMTAGAAVFKGKQGQAFENTKGVQILLSGTQKGLNLNIGPEGFFIQMEKVL